LYKTNLRVTQLALRGGTLVWWWRIQLFTSSGHIFSGHGLTNFWGLSHNTTQQRKILKFSRVLMVDSCCIFHAENDAVDRFSLSPHIVEFWFLCNQMDTRILESNFDWCSKAEHNRSIFNSLVKIRVNDILDMFNRDANFLVDKCLSSSITAATVSILISVTKAPFSNIIVSFEKKKKNFTYCVYHRLRHRCVRGNLTALDCAEMKFSYY